MDKLKFASIRYILFFCTLISMSFLSCRQQNNLIINGDFEQDLVSGRIPGWEMDVNMEKQKIWLEEKEAYHGQRSLAVRVIQYIKPVNAAGLAVRTGAQCILSQKINVEQDSRYVLSLMYRRESAIYGAFINIRLLDENGKMIPGGNYNQVLRSPFWTGAQLSFNSGKAKYADIRIINDTGGSWRISVGRTLWLDEVSLVQLNRKSNLQEVRLGKKGARGTITYDAPCRLYPWVKLTAEGPHDIKLSVAGKSHTFRTYTYDREVWVQPIIPDLIVPAGKHEVMIESSSPGVVFRRLLFTQNSTWKPKDAPEFLSAEDAIKSQREVTVKAIESGEIHLRIDGDLPEGRWPVTQGVPFPQGELWSEKNIDVVTDPGKTAIPFQSGVLSRWSDGSIRWLALSVQGEEQEKFLLRYNHPILEVVDPEKKVEIRDDSKGYTINTGVLQAFIPGDGSGLLGPVSVNGTSVLNNSVLTVNREYSSVNDKPVIKIEESGPVRVVVCLSGAHRNKSGQKMLDYIVRWFFHAGSSRVDMEHIFLQREAVVKVDIGHIDLVMELPGRGIDRVTPGLDAAVNYNPDAGEVIINSFLSAKGDTIRALYPYRISQNGRTLKEGFKYKGDFSARCSEFALCGWMQDFWQKGPSQLSFAAKSFTLGLVGEPGTPFYMGMQKTSRFTISFSGDKNAVVAFAADPLLMCEPEWYSSTLATGHRFMPFSNGKYAAYDSSMKASLQRMINSTYRSAENYLGSGFLQYGDIVSNYGGDPGVGMNLETALDEGSFVQFLRTEDRKVFDYARIAMDHFIDIDIDHSKINGGLIGLHGHHNREDTLRSRSGINGHSWFNGTGQFEMFRASRRIYDIADRVGQYYTRNRFELEPYIRGWRAIAWQFMALVQAFEITGKTEYLEAARQSLNVTNYQRDFMIEEWPYMYAVGIRAVRQYYSSSKDNLARELYLQLMDGFLRLRSRPHDVVNGEWEKPERTVLGNFPNDRSCIFYNEGAWAFLLSGDRGYVDNIAFDLNWQIALGVNDPTLICGSADLVKVMDELGIKPLKSSVELPWAFMPPEQRTSAMGKSQVRAGVMTFQVNEKNDRDFEITLFKSSVFKYTVPYEGFATVFSPSGKEVIKKPVSNKGINIYSFPVPADGETGKYTLEIVFDNIWQWTMEENIIDLKNGSNTLRIGTRFGFTGLDAIGLAPLGRFPWIPDDLEQIKVYQLEAGRIPAGWSIFGHPLAYGQKYVRQTTRNSEPVTLSLNITEEGTYRVFFRVWKPRADLVEFQLEGQPDIHRIQQIHDMTTTEFPTWSLSSSLGSSSVIKYW